MNDAEEAPDRRLHPVVYWLIVLEVEFEVLEPPALRERLALAGQRIRRSLARG